MPTNRLHFTIHQTFDLNTVVDSMTILAIKTPDIGTIRRYANLTNWKKIKFNSASFKLACVSQLPVDPLNVGTEPGLISPQELVNPMLFKTVTGESINSVLDAIYTVNYGTGVVEQDGALKRVMFDKLVDNSGTSTSPLDVYYTLLGDDSFRQAHPQVGIQAFDLIPLVREVLTMSPLYAGSNKIGTDHDNDRISSYRDLPGLGGDGVGSVNISVNAQNPGRAYPKLIHGRTLPMPSFDIWPSSKIVGNEQVSIEWPSTYVAVCVMPPAIQKSLYYRCIVSWNITLSEFNPSYNAQAISDSSHIYADWIDTPVSQGVAAAMELFDNNGVINTVGAENVRMVTESVS